MTEAIRLKDEFIATLGHELRQPLEAAAAALGCLEAGADPATTASARDLLRRQVRQMSRLVDDLMESGRIVRDSVSLHRTRLDVRTVVQEALDSAWSLIHERAHELATSFPSEPLEVDADSMRLQQVLVNLLSNAAKFTPPGGRIHVAVERDGRQATIRVRDTGIGIPPEELARVFDVFARAPGTAVPGFGIGLAVAKRLVEQHGGSIVARSEGAGQGTEFRVTLPLAAKAMAGDSPVSALPASSQRHGG